MRSKDAKGLWAAMEDVLFEDCKTCCSFVPAASCSVSCLKALNPPVNRTMLLMLSSRTQTMPRASRLNFNFSLHVIPGKQIERLDVNSTLLLEGKQHS